MSEYEYEVVVSASVEYTPRVDAESAAQAEHDAQEFVYEEHGALPERTTHETELEDGRHQVCVWANNQFDTTVTAADADEAEREAIEYVCREYDVQTDDVSNANARRLREADA